MGIPATCGCAAGKYLSSAYCYNCPTGCATCTSNTACGTCVSGYFKSGTLCALCMPVCKTCSLGTTCSSCDSSKGLTLNAQNICVCSSPNLLNPSTLTCSACSSFYSNCLSCGYNPSYSPSSPAPVVCTSAAPGYYLSGGGVAACGSYCLSCADSTTCNPGSCVTNFNNVGGACGCTGSNIPSNSNPPICDACSNIILGCNTCQVTTSTSCTNCDPLYYLSGGICYSCPSICTSCTSATFCTGCLPGMTPNIIGQCVCDTDYFDAASQTCKPCGQVIAGCLTCASTIPTTCLTTNTGSYITTGGSTVLPCPLNCATCDSTTCFTPNPGYTLISGVPTCDTACQACNSSPTGCTLCPGGICGGCLNGYYLSGGSCHTCMPGCLQCLDGANCYSCTSPFVVGVVGISLQCVCNATAGMYLTLSSTDCQTCTLVITDCQTCSSTPPTTCIKCIDGKFVSGGTTCLPCVYPCAKCTGASNYCDTCQGAFKSVGAGNCVCDHTASMWYSNITLDC